MAFRRSAGSRRILVGASPGGPRPRPVGWGFVLFGLISLTTWNLPALTTAIGFYLVLFIAVGIPGVATRPG